jgi:C-terminal processing protease CtpA/Prc
MLILPVLAALLAACTAGPDAGTSAPGPVDGVWRSDGYGWIIAVSGGRAQTFESTTVSCLPTPKLDQIGQPAPDGAVTFGRASGAVETLHRTPNGQASLRLLGTAADIDMLPLPSVPAPCLRGTPDDPLTNFDIYWATYADNYNSFTRKNVDWKAARDRYRPMVNANTSPDELYTILTEMTAPLGDAHTSLEEPGDQSFSGLRPGTRDEDTVSRREATSAVDKHLRADLGVTDIAAYANGKIAYADLPDGRGYLRITAFDHYVDSDNSPLRNRDELAGVLDKVFTRAHLSSWRGLVIDVRFNTGGDDALGLQVAGRLTDTPYTAYAKQARNDPADPTRHGPLRTVTVTPAAGLRYTGPVRLLISDLTVSASETFTEALLSRTPAPSRVGTNTQGVFADDMQRTLPNGWTFGLGNEDYFAPDGHNYEGEGIPPTVQVPVFTDDQLAQHGDAALDAP